VDENNFNYVVPSSINKDPEAKKIFLDTMDHLKATYIKLRSMKIKKEDARYVLPNAIESEIVITANMREYRRIFELRCAKRAQWEIREAAIKMLEILKEHCPNVFYDMNIDHEHKVLIKE
jgi:thymidylate synthase (FAD)